MIGRRADALIGSMAAAHREEFENMSDTPYVVQKVEWFQFRDPDGHAFFVMVSTLPNGFFTAVPCDLHMARLDHAKMGLGATADQALAQLQKALEGKKRDELFPPA